MKKKIFILAALAGVMAVPAQASTEGKPRLLGCYKRVLVPAEYNIKKTMIKKPERKYVKRNGRYELLEYPAVYREDKTLIKEEYYVMQEVKCN